MARLVRQWITKEQTGQAKNGPVFRSLAILGDKTVGNVDRRAALE